MSDQGGELREPIAGDSGAVPDGLAEQQIESDVLPMATLLELLTHGRALPDRFTATAVPEELMRLPIAFAIQWLDDHRRHCKNRNNCPDTPGPLRMLLKVHSRDGVARAASRIHSELWKRVDTTMVREVSGEVRLLYPELVDAAEDKTLFSDNVLRKTLTDDGEEGVQRLAAVLWARGLDDPLERELFRFLPAFLAPAQDANAQPAPPPRVESEPGEKPRHKKRREAAEAKVTDLEREISQVRTRGRERAAELTEVSAALAEALAERNEAQARITDLEAQLDEMTTKSGELEVARRELDADRSRAARAAAQVRSELERVRRETDRLERERRNLTSELAQARTRTESLEGQLRLIPRGKDAIATFLEDEEVRIDDDLVIAQGGDLVRARDEHAKRQKLEAAFREAYPQYVPPRPAAIGEVRTLRFTALGGGAEVGRSSYLIEIGASRILVDCGLAVGRREFEDTIPAIEDLGAIDAVVLTHAHTDHIGWLPALTRQQESPVSIYCHEATAAIVPIMLDDARGHYERMHAQRQRIAAHDPSARPPREHYTEDDLYDVETRLRAVGFSDRTDMAGTEVSLTLYPAGHILGAASVLLEGGGRRVLVSGDISSEPQATILPAIPPSDLDAVDLLVLESTYGNRPRDPADDQQRTLIEFVRRTTEHGTAILPCFALGRAQEVLSLLQRARAAGELDRSTTIWVDGLIRKINPIYAERGRLDTAGLDVVEAGERSLAIDDCRRADARAVVVTTSGMLTGGPVVEWGEALLGDPRNRMALLGYQDEGAPGGALRQLQRQGRPPHELRFRREDGEDELVLRISGPVREIGLSAHADQTGLVRYAQAIPARNIALVHGDPGAQADLAARLDAHPTAETVHCPGSAPLTIQ